MEIDFVKYNVPGMLVSVSKSAKSYKHYYAGLSNINTEQLLDPKQLFEIGRITRIFIVTVILQLVEQNLIDLDAPLELIANQNQADGGRLHLIVSQYSYLKPVTLRELMNNTSGIPSFDKTVRYETMFNENPKKIWQSEGYLDLVTAANTPYQSGYAVPMRGFFNDSTTNYILVGLIVEAVTGQRSSSSLQELFAKHNLQDTFYLSYGVLPEDLISRMVHGYLPASQYGATAFQHLPIVTVNNNPELKAYDVTGAYNFNGLSGSASVSTSVDLLHWFRVLLSGKVLTGAIKDMFDVIPIRSKDGAEDYKDYYGLGIYKTLSKRHGEIVWSAGNNYGYGVFLGYSINWDIGFVVAVNSSYQQMNLHSDLIQHFVSVVLD